ncbi:MAG TPA: hypothetical protein VF422_04455 [Dokdonella sp.]
MHDGPSLRARKGTCYGLRTPFDPVWPHGGKSESVLEAERAAILARST